MAALAPREAAVRPSDAALNLPFAQVALPVPVRQTFVYRVPEALADAAVPGAPVEVPFRGRRVRGVLVERVAKSAVEKVAELGKVLGPPLLSAHLLELASWVADYYLAPAGEVVAAMLPGGHTGLAGSRARKAAREDASLRIPLPERVTLTAAQREAVSAVESAVAAGRFAPFLLHGVTASGKTEVYLRGARAAREAGGQTLVLVPEVALGSQIVAQFTRRFGGRVALLHSYLGAGERRRNWELARRGAVDVVVGARSAVFAPLPAVKLIVVDEEHEPAYKQSEQLRYHGRDVAVRRAQMLGVPVVLGSATPALETLANAARGKYRRLVLPERVDRRALPVVRLADLRREDAGGGMLSAPLRTALAERLERGEQSLLWLNRRGHSHHVQCRGCGWTPDCPRCDITLTLHLDPPTLRCHYCDHREAAPAQCPSCRMPLLRFGGAGTQRAERELARVFPKARVLRLDLDIARDREAPADVLSRFARGEADVLLGTQMIAKGLDFPRVTLVGVLDADIALHLPDFRAAERTWQLLTQVAGRAGRGRTPGEVIVQSCTPEHPAIAAMLAGESAAFVKDELAMRREAGYPPFTRLVALLADGPDESEVEAAANALAERARAVAEPHGITVLGPAPQALSRLRGRHRWHLLLKGDKGGALRETAAAALAWSEEPGRRRVRVVADVDPIEVL
ncbi:MAG: primosomal protein N' [Candidatus Eisenbacteria bacterium]|nr:primosomal protein N' [Candidatus Eisenbacteria bacterium]